jgi:hypothetical protein
MMTVEEAIGVFAEGTKKVADQGYALGRVQATREEIGVLVCLEDRSGSILTCVQFIGDETPLADIETAFGMVARLVQ